MLFRHLGRRSRADGGRTTRCVTRGGSGRTRLAGAARLMACTSPARSAKSTGAALAIASTRWRQGVPIPAPPRLMTITLALPMIRRPCRLQVEEWRAIQTIQSAHPQQRTCDRMPRDDAAARRVRARRRVQCKRPDRAAVSGWEYLSVGSAWTMATVRSRRCCRYSAQTPLGSPATPRWKLTSC